MQVDEAAAASHPLGLLCGQGLLHAELRIRYKVAPEGAALGGGLQDMLRVDAGPLRGRQHVQAVWLRLRLAAVVAAAAC